jgi:anti-anti-sigma factor
MIDRPLIVRAPRMLLVRNREALSTHLRGRLDEGRRDLVLALDETVYIDSSGLGMLAALHREITRERGGRFRLCGLNEELRRLFAATRLDERLEMVDAAQGDEDPWRAREEWDASAFVPAFAR